MTTTSQQYEIRLSVENGKAVMAEMKQVGSAGKKSFQDVTDGANLLNNELGRLQSSIVGRLTAVLGPAALIAGVKASIESFSALEGAANRAGRSLREFQELQYMAVQFGESAESMGSALVEFNKRVAEAQNGQGKLLDVLTQYNIKLTDSQGRLRSVSDIYRDYADKVKGAANGQEQLRMAIAAFGDEAGKGLVDVLAQGSDGITNFAEKAHDAGMVIEDELIARAKQLDDRLKEISYTTDVLWKSSFMTVLDEAAKLFEDIGTKIERVTALVKNFWSAFRGNESLDNMRADFSRREDIFSGQQRNRALSRGADELLAGMPVTFDEWVTQQTVATPSIPEGKSGREQREREEEAARKKLSSVIDALKFRNEQMRRGNSEQELYNQLRAAGTTLDTTAGQEIKRLVDEYQKYQDEVRKTEEATEALQTATDGFFERLIDGFEDGKISSAEFQQALLQMFKEIVLARDSVTGASLFPDIMGQVSSGIGGLVSSIFGFANGGIMTSQGPLPLRAYAGGGIANSPQVAVYGEGKYAEAYVPLPDGRSIPVTMQGAAMAMNVNIIDQAGVDVQPQMSGNGKSVDVILKKKVSGMVRSGGLDSALRDRTGVTRTLRET